MGENLRLGTIVLWAMLGLMVACSGYRSQLQYSKLDIPHLGSIVHREAQPLYSVHRAIGELQWEAPLALKVLELPFNPHSYSRYLNYLKNAKRANTVPFNDSLPLPPRYIRLQLEDHVGLTQLLNAPSNQALHTYIQQDDDFALISGIDLAATDEVITAFYSATHVILEKDALGKPYLTLLQDGRETEFYFEELQIFDVQLLSFCWSEDQYHHIKVINLLGQGDRCPKGSYKKAAKLDKGEDYLKF